MEVLADAEAMENCYLQAYFFSLAETIFFCTQDNQTRGTTAHSYLGPFTSTDSQENVPQVCPHTNLK